VFERVFMILLACFECVLAQRAAKQLVPQPHLISAHYVGLAVVRNLLDLAFAEIALYLAAIEPFRFSRQADESADLMKSGFPCGLNDDRASHRSTASSVYRWK
jgi:hypothetical protein